MTVAEVGYFVSSINFPPNRRFLPKDHFVDDNLVKFSIGEEKGARYNGGESNY
jgi:hypothetical protein